MTDDEKRIADMMAQADMDMSRYQWGLYGGIAFNVTTAYEFMIVVNTISMVGKNKVYWMDKDDKPIELTLAEASKICGTLMKSYGRSLAGEHTLLHVHIAAYQDSNKSGAVAQNLKSNAVLPATPAEVAEARAAANAPAASS